MAKITQVTLGKNGPTVPVVALGCASFSSGKTTAERDKTSAAVIRTAVDEGMSLIDTADFYGVGHNETLIASALNGVARDKYELSLKFGGMVDPSGRFVGADGRPAAVKNYLAYSLRRLGTDYVDIYRPARLDPDVPIEETIGAIAEMVDAGYVRHIGLSEVSAETLRRASAVHPICDVQIEYALVSRRPEETLFPTCRELGVGVSAYGVLSHGLLTGNLSQDDTGAPGHLPRLNGENRAMNIALVENLRPIADELGVTIAELAIAWVLAKGGSGLDIVAVVGANKPERIAQNMSAAELSLSPEIIDRIEKAVPQHAVAGERYAPPLMKMLDSEKQH